MSMLKGLLCTKTRFGRRNSVAFYVLVSFPTLTLSFFLIGAFGLSVFLDLKYCCVRIASHASSVGVGALMFGRRCHANSHDPSFRRMPYPFVLPFREDCTAACATHNLRHFVSTMLSWLSCLTSVCVGSAGGTKKSLLYK